MPPSEIRKEAREALKGKWGKAALITLAFLAISMLMGFIQGFLEEGSVFYYVLDAVYLLLNIPLSFGLIISFINLKRNENVSAFAFFKEGFSRFGKSWGIWFHTLVRLLLPIICMVFIIILHIVLMIANATIQLNAIFSLLYVVLLVTTIIYIACRALLYVLAYYVSFDNPELSSKECVKKSEELMKGHRGNYFMLELSFIGWILLLFVVFFLGVTILSVLLSPFAGILVSYIIMLTGMLFLMPYMQVSIICFYEKLINNKTNKVKK